MVQVVIPDIVAESQNAFANGRDQARQQAVQHALSMASTDPQGAKNALVAAGEIGAANQIDGIQRQQKLDTTRATAQQQYAAGNVTGARDTAVMGGDPQLADALSKLHDDDLADHDRKMTIVGGFLNALADVPQSQRAAYVQQYRVPLSQQTGVPLDKIDSYDVSDNGLRVGIGQAVGAVKAIELEKARREANKPIAGTPGQVFFDPNTHQPIPGMSVPEKPDKPTYQKVTDPVTGKESIIQLGGGQQAPSPAAATGKFDSFYSGFLAPHEGGYTASDGNGAPANMGVNQKANPDVNVATLSPDQAKQIMHDRYWVPSGADKLPPGLAEIQGDTAVNMGVGAAQQLLQQSGGDPQKYLQLREARFRSIAQNDPTKADRLPGWLQRNQQLGQYVSGAGASAPASAAGGPARVVYTTGGESAASGDPSLTGQDYLKTLDKPRAAQVQAMIDGRMAFPGSMALKTPYWQQMLRDAAQVDPEFDQTKFAARNRTRTAFTTGTQGQNLASIQTLVGHLDDLDKSVGNLPNTNYPWLNGPVNALRVGMGDTKTASAIKNFETSRGAVATEMVRALRGSGGAEADVQHWLKVFNEADSPTALKSAISQAVSLIGGRLDPLRAQYQAAMGADADPLTDFYPRAAKIWARLGGEPDQPRTKSGPQADPLGIR